MTTPDPTRLPDTRSEVATDEISTDEISLRELYLVLKRRSPWILLAAVVVAAAAFTYASTRPPRYVAEGTTVVARAPIEVNLGTDLRFRPEASITFETYQTLAFSRSVLEVVVPHHDADDVATLRGSLTLERLTGTAAQPTTFLAVSHVVRSRHADVAATAAEVWIEATMATVRALMLENLDVLEAITGDALALARARVERAEEALEGVLAETAPDALRRAITAVDQAIVDLDALMREIDRDVSAHRAEGASLAAAQADGVEGVVLSDAPDVVLAAAGAMASLDARIAALEVRRERAVEQRAGLSAERSTLARQRADATVRIAALERELREGLQAVDMLTAIDPNVAYVAQVAPSGVRVLSEPLPPTLAEPTRATLIAVLAAVVTAFAGVVVALLAEAVRAPSGVRVNP